MFAVQKPLPSAWLTRIDEPDERLYELYAFVVSTRDSDVASRRAGLFHGNTFYLECCPEGELDCVCRPEGSEPRCSAAQAFCFNGRCAQAEGRLGHLNGGCRAASPTCNNGLRCDERSGKCEQDNPVCPSGKRTCKCLPAADGRCPDASLRCEDGTCVDYAPVADDVLGQRCEREDQSNCYAATDAPLSCQVAGDDTLTCQPCKPGSKQCACDASGKCDDFGVLCENAHCGGVGNAQGCEFCPCKTGGLCNGGPDVLQCVLGRCEKPRMVELCDGGGRGCRCVERNGRRACFQAGLECVQSAAHNNEFVCLPERANGGMSSAATVDGSDMGNSSEPVTLVFGNGATSPTGASLLLFSLSTLALAQHLCC